MTASGTSNRGGGLLTVTVGICAYNERRRIGAALGSLVSQALPDAVEVLQIVVVASGCTDGTEQVVETWAGRDTRVFLVREPLRMGKASAINQILRRAQGEVIVILNADAYLPDGALAELLRPFIADPCLRVACGAPISEKVDKPILQVLIDFQWELHNLALETLSDLREPNHCCDEFMAIRRGFIESLPLDLINDGAYIGALASQRGHSVLFCRAALVRVETPSTFRDFLSQRHRILRGHRQVRDVLKASANVLESLFVRDPALALGILVKEMVRRPSSLLVFLLLVLPLEAIAIGLASYDRLSAARYEPRWTPVE